VLFTLIRINWEFNLIISANRVQFMGPDISFRSLPNRPACSVLKSSTASSPPRADESRAELLLCRPSPVAPPLQFFSRVPPQPHPPPPPRSSRPGRALPRPESAICGLLELLLRPQHQAPSSGHSPPDSRPCFKNGGRECHPQGAQ